MAFIPVPDGALVTIEYGNAGTNWSNTLWFTQSNFGNNEMIALADYIEAWADTNIMPNLYSGWSRRVVSVYDMRDVTGLKIQQLNTPAVGGKTGDPAAIQLALVVTFYTAARGRSGRGRNYVTGFIEADVAITGISNPVVSSNIDTAYTNLIGGAGAINWTWSVVQFQENGSPLSAGVPRPIVSALVRNDTFGTQRRRVDRA
jgi:hypothetical protein